MRLFRYILPVIVAALMLAGCRSSSALKKKQDQKEQESTRLVHALLEAPPVQELTILADAVFG